MLYNFLLLFGVFIGTYTVAGLITTYLDFKTDVFRIEKKNINQLKITYKKILPNVLLNLTVINSGILYVFMPYINLFNYEFTIYKSIFDIIIIYGLIDIFLYGIHRLFHTKYLYKYHKIHHELLDPIGIGAIYTHPIDYICGTIIPLLFPCIIVSAHVNTIAIILFIGITNAIINSHSGYNFTKKYYNTHHIHHTKFKYNYGTLLFMDKLFNTEKY